MRVSRSTPSLLLSRFGVLLLGVLHLVGCTGGGGGTDDLTLVVWVQKDPTEKALFERHVALFQERHPGVSVEAIQYDTENLRTQFQTAALAGGGPDLVYGPSDQVGPFTIMQLIHPLDEMFDAELFAAFEPAAFDTLDGHIYALPDQIGNHLTLVYNKALVPNAPATTDDMLRAGKAATRDVDGDGRNDQFGVAMNLLEPFWLAPWLGGFGGWVMDATSTPTLDSPAMVGALSFLHDLKHEHGIMPAESSYEIMHTMFQEGRVGMIVNGPWSWQSYIDAGIDVGIAPLPKVMATGTYPTPMVATKGYSINVNVDPQKMELVKDFIVFLTSAEVQEQLVSEMRILPSRSAVYELPLISQDPILQASEAQLRKGRRMPVVVEMRAIWDSMRPELQDCINGNKTASEAARGMQERSIANIRSLRGDT